MRGAWRGGRRRFGRGGLRGGVQEQGQRLAGKSARSTQSNAKSGSGVRLDLRITNRHRKSTERISGDALGRIYYTFVVLSLWTGSAGFRKFVKKATLNWFCTTLCKPDRGFGMISFFCLGGG